MRISTMFSSIKLLREHGCGLVNSGLPELDMIAQSPTILIIARHVTAVLHGFQCFHVILTANFLVTLTIYLEIVKYIKTLLSCEAGLSFPYVCSKNRKEIRK